MNDYVIHDHIRRGKNVISQLFNYLGTESNWYICGGFANWVASPHDRDEFNGDIDIFCVGDNSRKQVFETVLKIRGVKRTFESQTALSLDVPKLPYKVQLIKQIDYPQDVKEGVKNILNSFDFTVCMIALFSPTGIIAHKSWMPDEQRKVLRIHNIKAPVNVLIRMFKYVKKGYSVPLTEAYKLFREWEKLPEEIKAKIEYEYSLLEEEDETEKKNKIGFSSGPHFFDVSDIHSTSVEHRQALYEMLRNTHLTT